MTEPLLVSVRLFYRDGPLYQPAYLGGRGDLGPADCILGQLKHKSEED